MYIEIGSLYWYITPAVLAGIIGGGVVLIILILLCVCFFCCRKDRSSSKRPQNTTVENPPQAEGNNNGEHAQQRQQQTNQPAKLQHRVVPNLSASPPAAVPSPLQQPSSGFSTHSPPHSPMGPGSSTDGSSSLPPKQARRTPTPYTGSSGWSESSNISGQGSSIPPPSPAFPFGSPQTTFTRDELAMATNGFSEANLLGQGGFGFVHKGVLRNGKEIAVKSLKANSGQGESEFQAEVEIISRVHHRHLVSLVGYCISGSQRLLVYEFVPNKTLEFHLHGIGQPVMDWPTRLKVAIGAAKGLAYLHEDCHPRIIHRDIKAANILLDKNFLAKVADFGLAKFASDVDTHVSTRVMGTLGYLAPEYASTGRLTDKSDVYSFGVVLLELITGRRPVDRTRQECSLVQWARPLLTTAIEYENFNSVVDPRLKYSYKQSEMARMVSCAATCVRKSARRRPLMSQVVRALEGNVSLSDLNEGITPGRSLLQRYETSSEVSGSLYSGNSRGFDSTGTAFSTREYVSNEHDGTTSEYGLYPSSSSSEGQTTQELNTEEVEREYRQRLQMQYH